MSVQPPKARAGLGDVAMGMARMTVRAAVNQALANGQIVGFVASRMFENEIVGKKWADLTPESRAIWNERARSAIHALASTLG